LKNETAKFSWRRIAIIAIAIAIAVVAIAAYAASMLRLQAPPAPAEPAPPKATPVASLSFLPPEVRQELIALCSPCSFADSVSPWNATDVIDDGLPQRRLAKTEKRGSDWIVQYQHGGFATHNHTVVFSLAPTVDVAQGSSCIPSQQACEW
jgi:hypothetical protein